jgi:hypothetical protein
MRLAMGNSFATVVSAEMIAADSGLGYLIFNSRLWMAADKIFIGIVCLAPPPLLVDNRCMLPMIPDACGEQQCQCIRLRSWGQGTADAPPPPISAGAATPCACMPATPSALRRCARKAASRHAASRKDLSRSIS